MDIRQNNKNLDRNIEILKSINRTSGNAQQGNIIYDTPLNGEYTLIDFSMTNRLYNVNDNNNQIYINIGGASTLSLVNGYYTQTTLATQIKVQLDTTSGTFSVAYSSTTGKYTIVETGASTAFTFEFGSNTNNSARFLMGYNESNTSSNATQISPNAIDLSPLKYIYIYLDHEEHRNISSKNYFKSSLLINSSESFGEVMRYSLYKNYNQTVKFKSEKNIFYKFLDLNNNVIDLNGQEWNLILCKN